MSSVRILSLAPTLPARRTVPPIAGSRIPDFSTSLDAIKSFDDSLSPTLRWASVIANFTWHNMTYVVCRIFCNPFSQWLELLATAAIKRQSPTSKKADHAKRIPPFIIHSEPSFLCDAE